MGQKKIRYDEILPRKDQWPIVQLSQNRKAFIDEVAQVTFNRIVKQHGSFRELLETTVYREKIRIKANPWKVDPPNDRQYWNGIRSQMTDLHQLEEDQARAQAEQIIKEIILKYSEEIAGNFKKSSYRFAKGFVTFGFARLLNATRVKGFLALFSRQLDLDDKIHIVGETEHIRSLARKGTVVMVPTHFSNLDSILIGWVIQFLGLPAFIYGAGLNLFNIKLIAYFMNSLGAYKVDRRKKNPIYLETLKTYSTLAIKKGCHSLFFPGGTRSRSGEIEKQLKLGLLGTAVEAQREIYQEDPNTEEKIFIVPVVINYQFTLEAPALIKDHLKRTGQERYYAEVDEFSNSYKILSFLFKFFTKGSDISVSIGRGLDVFGNYVDMDGNSLDKKGIPIDPRDYFISGGEITLDNQRDHQYVRMLADRIVEEYHSNNRVSASHLAAFVAFKMLEKRNPKLDLYSILRLTDEELEIDYVEFKKVFKRLRERIMKMHKKGKVDVANHLQKKADDSIDIGIRNLGMYHPKRPLLLKRGKIIIQDPHTLYYYHNRMVGYELGQYI